MSKQHEEKIFKYRPKENCENGKQAELKITQITAAARVSDGEVQEEDSDAFSVAIRRQKNC